MELICARNKDFQTIRNAYMDICEQTKHMKEYGKWVYGLHPSDDLIQSYIEKEAMYMLKEQEEIIGLVAITQSQEDSYHGIQWRVLAKDEEVAVIHLLSICPSYQGKGMSKICMEKVFDLVKEKKAIRLDALSCNTIAHQLYRSLGFVYCGKQNLYASNTGWIDFFFFEKEL
ncbi:MAG: GNAT family N-acetyltransferase [Bacillota bacterium]|nr:GNAT family N-acetyltransferase [Bacillota bacterium]